MQIRFISIQPHKRTRTERERDKDLQFAKSRIALRINRWVALTIISLPFSIHLSPLFLLLFCTIKAIPFIYHPHHVYLHLPFFFCCGEKGRLIQTKVKTKSGPFLVVLQIICSLHFLHEPELDSNPPTASQWTNIRTFSCRFFFCSKDRRVMSGLVSVTTCWSFHWTRGISPHLGHFLQSFRWPAEAEAAEGRKEGRLFLSNSFNSRSDPKKQINPTPCPTYSHSLDVSEGKGFISLSPPQIFIPWGASVDMCSLWRVCVSLLLLWLGKLWAWGSCIGSP